MTKQTTNMRGADCVLLLAPVPRTLPDGQSVGAGLLPLGQSPQHFSQRPRHLPVAQVPTLSSLRSHLLPSDFPL